MLFVLICSAKKRSSDFACGHKFKPAVEDFFNAAELYFRQSFKPLCDFWKRLASVLCVRSAQDFADESPSGSSLVDFSDIFAFVQVALFLDKPRGALKRDSLSGIFEFA